MQNKSAKKKVNTSSKKKSFLDIFHLKERCLIGNEAGYEAGYVGVIESVDKCIDELSQIGPTALDIDPLLHSTCGAGVDALGDYLLCITNNSDWVVPDEISNLYIRAKEESDQASNDFWQNAEMNRGKEIFTYKGKNYEASRVC